MVYKTEMYCIGTVRFRIPPGVFAIPASPGSGFSLFVGTLSRKLSHEPRLLKYFRELAGFRRISQVGEGEELRNERGARLDGGTN